jgi:hypothetical protein
MKNKLQLDKEDYAILLNVLSKYPYRFYAYGSRSRGYASKYSDLDIICKKKIKARDMVSIREQLEESNITINVDLLDSNSCSHAFLKSIEKDIIELR